MITKTWKIESMQAYPQHAGQSNVIFSVTWKLHGTDGIHKAMLLGITDVEYKEGDPYIPYDQLTEEQVISWIKEAMGPEKVAIHEANIDSQLDQVLNPKEVVLPNPWNS